MIGSRSKAAARSRTCLRGAVNNDTHLVLTNVIYFLGNWATPFDPDETQQADFHLSATPRFRYDAPRGAVRPADEQRRAGTDDPVSRVQAVDGHLVA